MKEGVNVIFEKHPDTQFRKSSTEDVEYKLEHGFGHNRENVSVLRSQAAARSGVCTGLDGSSILSHKAEVVGLSQSVASNDFWGSKDFDCLPPISVRGGSDNGNGGGSISDGSGIWISLGDDSRSDSQSYVIQDKGLWTVREVFIKSSEKEVRFL